ncbi:ester cyclase [Amycolatopsis lurida]
MTVTREAANKARFRQFHDAMNTRDLATIAKTIDEVVAPDVLFHAPVPSGLSGREALLNVWKVLLRAFPDIHVEVEDLIAEGDKVVSRNTVTGTHLGEYRGTPATGRTVSYNEMFIVRFEGEQVAELWGVVDVFGQLRQLGLVPA